MTTLLNAFIAMVFGALVALVLSSLDFWVRGLGAPGMLVGAGAGLMAFGWLQRGVGP